MSGLEAAAPVPMATGIVAEIASPAMWLMGRRIDALLDRDSAPTVIESASRDALDDTAAAYSEIVGVLLDTHFLARPPARRLAWDWWLRRRQTSRRHGVDSAPDETLEAAETFVVWTWNALANIRR
jgi:hypothetical protein